MAVNVTVDLCFQAAETEVQRLEKRLKSHIAKTRPYFEQKDVFNKALESQKLRVHDLQQKVQAGPPVYNVALDLGLGSFPLAS